VAKSKGIPEQQPQPEATLEASRTAVTEAGSASADLRQEAIAKAAYYKAERRGFAPGFEMQDWLDAEREAVSGEAGQ
jgi:hypothetical protein